jgi:integrase
VGGVGRARVRRARQRRGSSSWRADAALPAALKAAKLDEAQRFHDLRHTFGTAMAAAGVPMRTLQEWMGHRDLQTTLIYADYVPNAQEVAMVDRAFADPLQDDDEHVEALDGGALVEAHARR